MDKWQIDIAFCHVPFSKIYIEIFWMTRRLPSQRLLVPLLLENLQQPQSSNRPPHQSRINEEYQLQEKKQWKRWKKLRSNEELVNVSMWSNLYLIIDTNRQSMYGPNPSRNTYSWTTSTTPRPHRTTKWSSNRNRGDSGFRKKLQQQICGLLLNREISTSSCGIFQNH